MSITVAIYFALIMISSNGVATRIASFDDLQQCEHAGADVKKGYPGYIHAICLRQTGVKY